MRRLLLAALVALLATGARAQTTTTTTLPSCFAVGKVDFWVVNETDQDTIQIDVDGTLAAPGTTCSLGDTTHDAYQTTLTCTGRGPKPVYCGSRIGLHPGAWVHRVTATVAGVGTQHQTRRAVVIAPSATNPIAGNAVVWTVYGFVRTATGAAGLRTALADAAAYTAQRPAAHALIKIAPGTITSPGTPDQCPLDPVCTGLAPKAGFCVTGDRIVLDGRGEDGTRAATLAAGSADPLLRIYGSDVEVRGLVLTGSHTAVSVQADTIDFMNRAKRSAVVDCLVNGPSFGDAVGAQCRAGGAAADANLVVASTIAGAKDKGIKISDGAWQVVSSSCIHDNKNGGIQATLGGHAVVRENVVQHNVPNKAENGIFANGDGSGFGAGRTTLATRGNVVRFAGNRGLSVTDDAEATFADDFVARNQYAGARVETSRTDLVALAPDRSCPTGACPPVATFSGVAAVCNGVYGSVPISGSCTASPTTPCIDDADCAAGDHCAATFPDGLGFSFGFAGDPCTCTASPCPCLSPSVRLADGASSGPENATNVNWNPNHPQPGENLSLAVPGATLGAAGTQWENCADDTCTAASVLQARNVDVAAGASVDIGTPVPPTARPLTLTEVSPARPRAGEVVRVYGTGFDVISQTKALAPACHSQPPARGTDFCDPSDAQLAKSSANKIKIARGGANNTSIQTTVDLVAVTPTMLAFVMPFDCYSPAKLQVTVNPAKSADIVFCDPDGCAGMPAGVACADDGQGCTADVCNGAGACMHPLLPASTVCRPAAQGHACDAPETCNGTDPACPADGLRPAGFECRPAVDLCDKPEVCNGTSIDCPAADLLWGTGHVCRPPVGGCDAPETCTGTSAACPADRIRDAGYACRPSRGACDVAETCDGASTACPADVVQDAGTLCRASRGVCDLAESCDGVSPACPADAKRTDVCRPSAGACDMAESCDGVGDACPADAKQPASTVCRAAVDACDVAETCDGTSDACPADAIALAGTVCRDARGACDDVERCDGASTACPADRVKAAGTTCRAAADACDLVEQCDGTSSACPADARATGFDAVGCVVGQLDATVDAACQPRGRSLGLMLQKVHDALQRAAAACSAGRSRNARTQLRRAAVALDRFRRVARGDACLRGTTSVWQAQVAAGTANVKALRESLAGRCGSGR